MTKTFDVAFVPATTRVRPRSSHLFVRCQCAWMRAEIRFSSTCLTLHVERMAQTTWKHYECKCMQTVVFVASTLVIASTLKKNYHHSSSCFCLLVSNLLSNNSSNSYKNNKCISKSCKWSSSTKNSRNKKVLKARPR
uniref:Uncharacterized protein n=1 Tax=Lygus hesperus TaxID=30085 RepID=A0A146LDS1_LYGHE